MPASIEAYYYKDAEGNEITTSKQDSATILRPTISSWYNAIRNICIVLMLSVLVYIGIRMLLTTVAQEKAKYVNMIKDWFIGLCLLFLMHYIMAFSVALVNKLTNVVKTSVGENGYVVVMEDKDGEDGKLCKAVKELGKEDLISTGGDGKTYVTWPTNLMGDLRLKLQMEDYGAQYIGYGLCFVILCLFTVYFTIVYAKRLLHMAFLTLIAPMVALTYCIDRINDGQAQGFNKWLKEYIFNLLIQPMHLLLYYILVTSAFELAGKNVLYSLAALGFMIPAEKLLRSLFGFEKASTAPALGPAGAMMTASILNNLMKGKTKANKTIGGKGSENEEDQGRIPGSDSNDPVAAFAGEDREQANLPGAREQNENTQGAEETGNNQGGNSQREEGQQQLSEASERLRFEYGRAQEQQQGNTQEGQQAMPEGEGVQDSNYQPRMTLREKMQRIAQQGRIAKDTVKRRISRPKSAFGRAFKANWEAQKAAIKNAPKETIKAIANAHPMKTAGKVAAGVVGSTAAAGIAIPAAITTGELGNISKVGLAAGATAYSVSSGRASNVENPANNELVKGIHNDTYNGPDYDEKALETYITNYLKDIRKRNYFNQRNNNKKEVDKMFERGGEIETYLKNDISSMKEMQVLHQLQKDNKSGINNTEQAIAIQQLAGMIGSDTNRMNQKNRDDWQNRIAKMAEKNSNVKDAKKFAANRMEQIDKFYDMKSKL